MRRYALAPIAIVLCWSGCAVLGHSTAALPMRNSVKLDQLVVHSDFEIPKQHRLLQEVNALRQDISGKLILPTSDEPIHVYVFEDGEKFTSFIHAKYPQLPDRRAFFVETDTRLSVYAQWGEHVAVDLRHEVTHGYLHSVLQNLPLWLDEGLAEYFEMPRGKHGFHRLNIDALLAEESLGRWRPDLHRLENLKSVAEMGRVEYAESWAWVHLLLETDPSRVQLLHDYLVRLRRDAVSEPLSIHLRQANLDDPNLLLNYVHWLNNQG